MLLYLFSPALWTPFAGLSCTRSLPYLITEWVPGGTILASISAVLLVLVAISMYLTATGDPGILPRSPEVPDEILRNPAHPRERIVYVDQTPITTKYCGTLAGSAILHTALGVELPSWRRGLRYGQGDAVRFAVVGTQCIWSACLARIFGRACCFTGSSADFDVLVVITSCLGLALYGGPPPWP